ncbi:cyclic nucleotide-binding domain-containing protein [Hydrogenophaga defluvii]|uniref:Cyclic nucleotide-binding domain-containing protein n=1 Tax=Hydrogenophaga defluvii TaxID=249410 RepID=A0ABW2SFW8_9BURK
MNSTHFELLGGAQDHAAEIHEIFGNTPVLDRLDLAETTALCRYMAVYSAGRHTRLMQQGELTNHLLIVLTGSAEAVQTNNDGSVCSRLSLAPGDSWGELALLNGEPVSATCVTTEPVDFLLITRSAYKDLLLTFPRLANKLLLRFLHTASKRLEWAQTRLQAGAPAH